MTEDPISGANAGSQDVVTAELKAAKSPEAEVVTGDFSQFDLSRELLQAITEAGYEKPTPIQAKGIPPALERRDLIGIAQTGTGKTASFALPMIELLSRGRARARMPRSLILEPTRELAAQVAESFEKYTKYHKLTMALLIGGTSFDEQDRKLDRGADVLIATPGRLIDHFERGKLMLSQTQILVIDEADRMLDMGFIPDIERICKLIPFTRQTLFYSATMPSEIRRLTEQFLQNPVQIEVARPATTAANITQTVVDVPSNDWAKREALRRLIDEATDLNNAIVFCNRKHDVDIVARSLKKHGYNAAPLHGDLDQSVRTRTLDSFRSGEVPILVASDVAARGLDIPEVSHVFNFDVPFHSDDYVHRIGRTGRAGRSGATFMLAASRDEKYLESIEKLIGQKLSHRTLEGLAEAVRERPPRRGRDGRDGRKDRGRDGRRDRGRNRDRNASWTEETQVTQVTTPVAEASRQAEPAKQVRAAKGNAPKTQNRNLPKSQQPFGADPSQLPAFLLRPVPLPKTYTRLPEEDEELEEELREEALEMREEPRKSDKPRRHSRRRGRKGRDRNSEGNAEDVAVKPVAPEVVNAEVAPAPEVKPEPVPEAVPETTEVKAEVSAPDVKAEPVAEAPKVKKPRKPRKASAKKASVAEAEPEKAVTVPQDVAPAAVEAPAAEAAAEAAAEPVASAKKPARKKAATKKVPAKKAAAKKTTTKKVAAEKVTTKKAATKKATTQKTATKKAAAKKAVTEKAAAGKSEAEKPATKKAVTKKAATKKASTKKAATKKSVTKKAAPKKTTRKRAANKADPSAD